MSKTDIFDGERGRVLAQPSDERIGDVMTAIAAIGVSTIQDEQRGSVIDDDMAGVASLRKRGFATALFNVEPERAQSRDFGAQTRGLILALAALGESQMGFARSAVHGASSVHRRPRLRVLR